MEPITETEDLSPVVYNVTTKVAAAVSEEWLTWIKNEQIPEMIATGCFEKALILQLTEVDESEGPTFAVQYSAPNKAFYNRFIQSFSDEFNKNSQTRWGAATVSFRTVLRVVN